MLHKIAVIVILVWHVSGRTAGSSLCCFGGSSWNGKSCECPTNMINLNGKCVCDYNYRSVGNNCEKCDSNASADGNSCLGNSTNCAAGYISNGNVCTFNWKINNCGTGLYWNGLFCSNLTYPIICEAGYTWSGQACTLFGVNTCSSGSFWK
jgi:hypothetical protein